MISDYTGHSSPGDAAWHAEDKDGTMVGRQAHGQRWARYSERSFPFADHERGRGLAASRASRASLPAHRRQPMTAYDKPMTARLTRLRQETTNDSPRGTYSGLTVPVPVPSPSPFNTARRASEDSEDGEECGVKLFSQYVTSSTLTPTTT